MCVSGFKSVHSTESALLRVLNDIYITTDSGDSVVLILLDLLAAFDTVDHSTLLSRLESWVGLKATVLNWFQSYLSDRKFLVKLGNFTSSPAPLSCGLPQGSILSPSLFSLYMLPLGSILRKHGVSFHFFADDTHINLPIKRDNSAMITSLLQCLEEVKSWLAQNFLFLNEDKTEVIVFGSNENSQYICPDLDCLSVFRSSQVRNLGVLVDQHLKFDNLISSVIGSSFYQLCLLSKIRDFLTPKTLEMAVHAFVTSWLDYCNSLYCGISKSQIARLQLVQNAAARLLLRRRKHEHITPILRSLQWLPVHQRIDFKILLFVFKSLHNLAPVYLSELLHLYTPSRSLRSCNQALLVVPHVRLKCRGERAFSVAGPRLWNTLPLEIRMAPSLSVFKSLLKAYLFFLVYWLLFTVISKWVVLFIWLVFCVCFYKFSLL